MTSQSVESVFRRSWALLSSNWIIVLPGIVIGIVAAVINGLLNPPFDPTSPGFVLNPLGRAAAGFITLALAIAQYAYTTGMAGAAWQRGKSTLADGTRAFERDAGNILMAMVGLFVIGIVAVILMLPTLGLSIMAMVFFFIYTFPAAVVGERPGLTAIADSYRMALARPVPTLIVVAVIAVLAVLLSFVVGLLSMAPLVGPIIQAVALQALGAYVTLVVVGEYLALRGTPAGPA